MKILVTGGGGFLGRHIVDELLEKGHSVRVLGRSKRPELEAKGVEVALGDIANMETVDRAVSGCDAVIHTAAKAGIWGKLKDYQRANIDGSRNVVTACRRHSVRKLVYTSTPSVVFSGESFSGADESLPYGKNWLCHYAQTKSFAEQEVLNLHDQEKLQICALRPHLIWGVGDPHLLPRIIARAAKKKLRIVGTGNNRVDMTHVKNAAHAHILALEALETGRNGGKAYFLSDGEPIEVWTWLNSILERLSIPTINKKISFKKAFSIGKFMEWLWKSFSLSGEPPMTRFVATELAKDHWFDISAAKKDFDYKPIISRKEAENEYIEHYLQQLKDK